MSTVTPLPHAPAKKIVKNGPRLRSVSAETKGADYLRAAPLIALGAIALTVFLWPLLLIVTVAVGVSTFMEVFVLD